MPRCPTPLLPALALLALAACKSATPQGEKPWTFACPDPGSHVVWDTGRRLVFAGADPADPAVCLAGPAAGGTPLRLAWGMVEEGSVEGTGHAAGMKPLFPARTGATATYVATVTSPGSFIQYRFDTNWRMLGFETLDVPAGRFPVVAFERRVQGTGANAAQGYTVRYWVDGVSGIVLQRSVEIGRGGSTLLRGFQAREVGLPPLPRGPAPVAGAPGS